MDLHKLNIDKKYVITMDFFVKNYLGIYDNKLSRVTHKDLKMLGVGKTVPFDILTKDDVMRGNVLLVRDKKGHVAPYINPYLLREGSEVNNDQYKRKRKTEYNKS